MAGQAESLAAAVHGKQPYHVRRAAYGQRYAVRRESDVSDVIIEVDPALSACRGIPETNTLIVGRDDQTTPRNEDVSRFEGMRVVGNRHGFLARHKIPNAVA